MLYRPNQKKQSKSLVPPNYLHEYTGTHPYGDKMPIIKKHIGFKSLRYKCCNFNSKSSVFNSSVSEQRIRTWRVTWL